MKKKILFIEDNSIKANSIITMLKNNYDCEIVWKESFRSGIKEAIYSTYDLLLLDMSLTNWERHHNFTNNFERFGGITILREMKRKGINNPTIVITMFSEFGVGESFVDLKNLDEMLIKDFPNIYMGYIKYISNEKKWERELMKIIDSIWKS